MKRDTSITKGILVTARYILSTQSGEFTNLIDRMDISFQGMLSSVKKYKLFTTIRDFVLQVFSS